MKKMLIMGTTLYFHLQIYDRSRSEQWGTTDGQYCQYGGDGDGGGDWNGGVMTLENLH